ncbi:MAG: hypothetical protein LH606_00010 [Cytophagaceae bacterium]|nr:hypothetical protein [Cytophagaceae bacterium]
MKPFRFTAIIFLLFLSDFVSSQAPSNNLLLELNGSTDIVRFLTANNSRVWRITPVIAKHIKGGIYMGAEIPITYVHLKNKPNVSTVWGYYPNGDLIYVEKATSTNIGLSLFVRKNILLSNNFLLFTQLGAGYHVFQGNSRMTSNERFSQHWEGFAPAARLGLVYKLNERWLLNTNVHYSTASRLNIFVQRRPNMVSLQFGVTFLPRF